jgi:alpha-ketoglutarate-dependent dioxygenase alkB family protein 2
MRTARETDTNRGACFMNRFDTNRAPSCPVDYLNERGANVEYLAGFLSEDAASCLMQELLGMVHFNDLEASRVFVHGRWHDILRRQTAYGDPGTAYRFAGCRVAARPWVAPLSTIRLLLQEWIGFTSNFVLLNCYADGKSSIGWHSDDEADLGAEPTTVSILLGAARDFQLRPRRRFPTIRRGQTARPRGLTSSATSTATSPRDCRPCLTYSSFHRGTHQKAVSGGSS